MKARVTIEVSDEELLRINRVSKKTKEKTGEDVSLEQGLFIIINFALFKQTSGIECKDVTILEEPDISLSNSN